ncbi:MAG: alpha-glucosidase C-terminal domain-containing protein [Bdellovibrionales bacterium]|nr:alpha-glucosidase C-terminal domain-containing protein [Bdellovibrionales bacterium]
MQADWLEIEAEKTLRRLVPRLGPDLLSTIDEGLAEGYLERLRREFPKLFALLHGLYGHRYDFFYHLEDLLKRTTAMWIQRTDELKGLDAIREHDPKWFESNRMVGAMCYVDLFAGDLEGIRESIPYFKELGINYLHLMPIFLSPQGDDDGGYAISSYRELNAEFGTMKDLADLAGDFRNHGISLVLDFIFNHTSDEHIWAIRALDGDLEYQQYYRMFPDRTLPDRYEQTLGEIFPDEHPGAFSYRARIKKWVWTTFHTYQWDLNYENPAVFSAMAEEMLFLANIGVEVLRLDAIAFLWKELGTTCENLSQTHQIVQAFNRVARIAAPAVVFKSEAIVHPDEVGKYVSREECQLSYNPNLMALLWSTLATRDVTLLNHSLRKRFATSDGCAWVNYLRCHDDIGWAFSNEDAAEIGVNGDHHRRFLSQFYTGDFSGSFARGLPFQVNEKTGDMRISGMAASLCGMEQALEQRDETEVELAIRRILMLHGILFTLGGIPLIYLGDELATMNDYGYQDDADKLSDSRWVHRPKFDWTKAERRTMPETIEGKMFSGFLKLVQLRTQTPAFMRTEMEILETGNTRVFAYFRVHEEQTVLVLANFSEQVQSVSASRLRQRGMKKIVTDIVAGRTIIATQSLDLEPFQFMVLVGVR